MPNELRGAGQEHGTETETRLIPEEKYELAFLKYRTELIGMAQEGRDNAVNYRGFLVGCSMLAEDKDGNFHTYKGGNFRPTKEVPSVHGGVTAKPKGVDKRCAERNAIEQALKDGMVRIVAVVTAATEKNTGDDSRGHHALRPCDDCCQLLSETSIVKSDTIFHGIHDHKQPGNKPPVIVSLENYPMSVLLKEEAAHRERESMQGAA